MYDYIIVGAGSAGCVLANRLSADGQQQVCLLEAGPNDSNPLIHMPGGVVPLVRGWFANWNFWTEPQPGCAGRRIHQPRGKVLGGSSSINATVCTRGHAWDYDHWAELGCSGWSYPEVLPYFIRSEHYDAALSDRDRPFHGSSGPLSVSERRYTNPLSEVFIEAAQQAGHPRNDDFNGAEQEGFGNFKVFQKDGQRCSNARAYLTPEVRNRPNLTILSGAQVTQVLLQGKRAVGVKLRRDGRDEELRAQKEVILSAGAFQSPQLLLLSGIGPKAELARHGIAQQHELPGVGENLQDHLDIIVETKAKSRVPVSFHPMSLWASIVAFFQYLFGKRGMLTSNFVEAGGFFKSSEAEPIPDLQAHFAPSGNVENGFKLSAMLDYRYIAFVCDLRPLARGRVTLASADPLAAPLIDGNFLSQRRDVMRLVAGVRKLREVLAQKAFDAHRDVELSPGPALQSDAQLEDWVRRNCGSNFHPVGTCKMGVDEMAVVDPQLRVRGIEGLRVVDASIMPSLVGSNTNAPSTMIGEKGADLILEGGSNKQDFPHSTRRTAQTLEPICE
ncbi:MAG TPA: choline dehydrogenase [Solimonas sp.]|nr:choline dehydrogenase [Solimonas sp.]